MSALGSVPGVFFTPLFGLLISAIWLAFAIIFGYGIYLKGSYDSKFNLYNFTYI